MFNADLKRQATDILTLCTKKGLKLTTAESCTGGLLAALFTDIPGASKAFERGVITYSNESKIDLLGVDAALIKEQGAVSDQVAVAMADGAIKRARADLAVAITGIAGPDGGTNEKPVGLVIIAVAAHDSIIAESNHFTGDRSSIRLQAITKALEMLKDKLERSFTYVA